MSKPRILLTGGFGIDNYERCWLDWLIANDFPSEGLDYKASLGWIARSPFLYRFLWHFGRKVLENVLSRALWNRVSEFNPDLVLIIGGRLVNRTVLEKIHQQKKSALFHFYGEYLGNPLNTTRCLLQAANTYDAWFTANQLNFSILKQLGVTKAKQVPFGYNPGCHHPVELVPGDDKKYGSDVVFVGTWELPREQIMEQLKGVDVKVWGNLWDKLPENTWLRQGVKDRAVYCEEMARVFRASKICLSFLRKANHDMHTIRTFEIPACGGFQLSERTEEILDFFTEDEEIVCFDSLSELKDKIAFYLSHETFRGRIAEAGLQRIRNSGYSYPDRLQTILNEFIPSFKKS